MTRLTVRSGQTRVVNRRPEPGTTVVVLGHSVRRMPCDAVRRYGDAMSQKPLAMLRAAWRSHPRLTDAVLAGFLVAAGVAQLLANGMTPISLAGMLAMTAPVAWRRTAPLAAVTVGWIALFVQEGFGADVTSQGYGAVIALVITVYTAAVHTASAGHSSRSRLRSACDLAERRGRRGSEHPELRVHEPHRAGALVRRPGHPRPPAAHRGTARTVGGARERARGAHPRGGHCRARTDGPRDARRAHLLRQRHGGAARRVARILESDPETARSTIESVGRPERAPCRSCGSCSAWAPAGQTSQGRPPNPGLARIDDLAEAMRRSGLPVDLTVDLARGHDIVHLPGPIDLAAYRIVQESLTNTLRHAPGARATVRITLEANQVNVLVTDSGGRHPATTGGGKPGFGIDGMRERARLCGGELTAGSDGAGGFTVRAVLPTAVRA